MRVFCLIALITTILLQHNTVTAITDDNPLGSEIVQSFMNGLEADNPKQAVEIWILGVKNRSGAVQFAELSPTLQKQTLAEFKQRKWVTGQSSPWVDNFRFVEIKKIKDSKMKFTIEYNLLTSFKNLGTWEKVITVERDKENKSHWFITEIKSDYNKHEAFTPAEKIIK